MRRGGGGRILSLFCYILTDPVVFVVFSGRGRSRGGRSGSRSGGRSLDGSLNSCEFLGCASYDGGSGCRGRGDLDSTLSLVRSCNGRSRERVGKGRRNARRRVDKFISDRKFSLVEVPSESFTLSFRIYSLSIFACYPNSALLQEQSVEIPSPPSFISFSFTLNSTSLKRSRVHRTRSSERYTRLMAVEPLARDGGERSRNSPLARRSQDEGSDWRWTTLLPQLMSPVGPLLALPGMTDA